MKPEVVVISKEKIKPSSPTPEHLRHYDLSFIDQMSPPLYMPFVLYYTCPTQAEPDQERISDQLKKSLSESLVKFYPLAGRLKGNLYVDCNDEGVEFVEAMVKCKISEVIHSPNASDLTNLTPHPPRLGDVDEFLLAVQVDLFECGGLAIGLCMSHKVADALSFFTFIRSWAATSFAYGDQLKDGGNRGVSGAPTYIKTPMGEIHPQFDAVKLFPPMRSLPDRYHQGVPVLRKEDERIVSKWFAFEESKLAALKHQYASATLNDYNDEQPRPPTRIEALSAFMWTRLCSATRRVDHNPVYIAIHTINLRPRMDPPLPECSFGNLCWLVVSLPPTPTTTFGSEGGREEMAVVREMRKAIRGIDSKYMKKVREEGVGEAILRPVKDIESKAREGVVVTVSFSSLCRFGIYELADFGWGKPAWASPIGEFTKNLVVFMDSPAGDAGVEAWVCLESKDMVRFEAEMNTSFLARDATELSA